MIGPQEPYSRLEMSIIKAALKGNEEIFIEQLEKWKSDNKVDLEDPEQKERYKLHLLKLLNRWDCSLLATIMQINPGLQEVLPESKNIILHILNEMEGAGLPYSSLHALALLDKESILSTAKYSVATSVLQSHNRIKPEMFDPMEINQWAAEHNAIEVLKHNFSKQLQDIQQVRDLILMGKLQEARRLASQNNVPHDHIFESKWRNQLFFDQPPPIGIDFAPGVNRNKILVDLVENHDVGPSRLLNSTVSLQPPAPELEGTSTLRLMNAFEQICATPAGTALDFEPLQACIRETLGGCDTPEKQKAIATDLFALLTTSHMAPFNQPWFNAAPAAPANILAENEKVAFEKMLLELLNNGADLPFAHPVPPDYTNTPVLSLYLDQGMESLIDHPSYITYLKNYAGTIGTLGSCQFDVLSCIQRKKPEVLDLICRTIEPSRDYLQIDPFTDQLNNQLSMLCNEASAVGGIAFDFTTLDDPANADVKEEFEKILAVAATLLKYNLVDDRDRIKPGYTSLAVYNDPETNAPYDLHKFIMDQPILKAGWMRQVRDKELMETYAITKALVEERKHPSQPNSPEMSQSERQAMLKEKETEMKQNLEKLNKVARANNPEPEQLAQSIAAMQKDVQALILARVKTGEGLSSQRKEVTAHHLIDIARKAVDKRDKKLSEGNGGHKMKKK